MAVEYELHVKNRAGVLQQIVTDFRRVEYVNQVNAPGLLTFDISSDHQMIGYLEPDGQIEMRRRDPVNELDWYVDFYGLYVDEERRADSDGNSIFRGICPGQMDFLAREIVAWRANTTNRNVFNTKTAEYIAKTLVEYNALPASATVTNGRLYTTDLANISIQAGTAAGETMTILCAYDNLLAVLQKVASIGGGDFALVRTGAQAWEFRWYDGQLGVDRSASVVFALQYGNMANPVLQRGRISEKTRVVAGGQGEESDRTVAVRTGANYSAAFNSKTIFLNASQYTTIDGLNAAADIRLDELRARDDLNFGVLQIESTLYGKHYNVGDLVTGYYEGVTATKKITAAKVVVANGAEGNKVESIVIETGNV